MPIIHQPNHGSIRLTAVYSIFNTFHNSLIGTVYPKDLGNLGNPTVRFTTHEFLSVHITLAKVQIDKMSHKHCLLNTEDLRNGVY